MNNYERMQTRRCWCFNMGPVHPAICTCGDYFWEHSHWLETPLLRVLIHDDERERMRGRWYEEINTRRWQMKLLKARGLR